MGDNMMAWIECFFGIVNDSGKRVCEYGDRTINDCSMECKEKISRKDAIDKLKKEGKA